MYTEDFSNKWSDLYEYKSHEWNLIILNIVTVTKERTTIFNNVGTLLNSAVLYFDALTIFKIINLHRKCSSQY